MTEKKSLAKCLILYIIAVESIFFKFFFNVMVALLAQINVNKRLHTVIPL